ncbi:MAG: hypothetical protein UH850_12475 [Paludibacteraceae bacterium]|nr:hypothetical protein [Paludibacteraceae bacterium]
MAKKTNTKTTNTLIKIQCNSIYAILSAPNIEFLSFYINLLQNTCLGLSLKSEPQHSNLETETANHFFNQFVAQLDFIFA